MAIEELTWDAHPLSAITEQEEPHSEGDDRERPEDRRMQYVGLTACYRNQASCALFFSA
jgi:superfamily I DNA/RNA helicase